MRKFADYKKFDREAIRQIEAMAAAADQTIARISNYNQGLTRLHELVVITLLVGLTRLAG